MLQHRLLHLYFVVNQFLFLFLPTNCDCNRNDNHRSLPNYQLFESNQLPRDVQVTVIVPFETTKTLYYVSETDKYELSITITTCTSPVRWSVKYRNNSDIFVTNGMDTKYFSVNKGNYNIDLESLNQTSFVHIYISTELGGPQTLKTSQFQNFKLLPKQKRKRLTIKWHSSLVDPQGTEYCLIINTYFHYPTLCQAQFKLYNSTNSANESILGRNQVLPIIACTGRKTQFILTNLKINQTYYFDLFAINHQTNFIYPYGREIYKFSNFKPITLKNDKLLFVNIKEFDNGKIIVRYKINNNNKNNRELYLFIIPCGGIIEIEITTKNKTITSLKRIEGFGNVTIYNSNKFARYYLKIFAMNYEELKKLSGVKVFITNKSPMNIPFPNMPPELNLKEYHLLKTCNSVTIGWFKILSNQSDNSVNYCILIREGRLKETDDYIITNQCNPDRQLVNRKGRKSKSYCLGIKSEKRVIIHKIDNLRPGKNYIVQVTAKKLKGKTLSYNLLQVYTQPYCDGDDYIENVTNKR